MSYYCSECKKGITPSEYRYSIEKYGNPLCRNHQKQLSDSTFVESIIKGRIAETLIEELFLQLGYSVFRFGMENTIPGVMKLFKGKEYSSDVATYIRKMPDFVVQDTKTSEVYFIEVKFRKNGTFTFEEVGNDYPYEDCFFVVVSKKHIKCISYKELKDGKEVNPKSRNYLGSRKEFELDKDLIINFCEFAIKFFEVV